MPLAGQRHLDVDRVARGLRIDPRVPGKRFALHTELCDLLQDGAMLSGAYRPLGARELEVVAPAGSIVLEASRGGTPVSVPPGAKSVVLQVPATPTDVEAYFTITTGPS